MRNEERTLAVLEEVQEILETVSGDLLDDGFEEYSDALQDAKARLVNLHYVLTNKNELPLGD